MTNQLAPGLIIETHELTKRYGKHAAVDRIDLRVGAGSVYGLVGPNGSGKTTTLAMLAGLRRPTGGTIALGVERARRSLLPDTPSFDPWLTGFEVVDLARALVAPELPSAGVDEALEEAGLTDAAGRRVGGYSRGMLQRLGVAATLVSDPDLVMLDEPCSSLDPVGRREVLDLIARQRGKRTAIFSSHILADVQEICDTVGVMRDGRLVYQGPLEELLVGDAIPFYRVRLRTVDDHEADRVAASLRVASWITAVDVFAGGELRVSVDSLASAERELSAALARADTRVVSLQPEEPSLERAFLELTK